jgi:hypothetical protein
MVLEIMELVMVGWVCDGEDEEGWIEVVRMGMMSWSRLCCQVSCFALSTLSQFPS